jgi:CBS domain containing-hemolysin-like protein
MLAWMALAPMMLAGTTRARTGTKGLGEAPMGWLLVAALALIFLAGWCATAETALLRISRAGAKELGRSPGEGAAPLQGVLAEISRYLAVLVFVRVAGEISATVLVTAVLVHRIAPDYRAYLIAAAVMIVLSYLIATVIPRGIGRQHAVRVATSAAAVLRPVVRLLGPIPSLLLATGSALSPGSGHRDGSSGSEEELRGLVDLLEQRQIIQPDERAMIHSVFELGDTIVREVMVPRTDMVFVEGGKTLRQALSLALRSGFSRIPVVGENLDDVIGIAYLKDLVTRGHEHREGESVETVDSVMRPATFVPESKPIDELLREMQARQIHQAIVIDEYGGTAGLVTIEDILEEIVGEIADEYDREQPPVEWLSENRARVTARLSVEELEELFDVSIEAEDVETVGGLLAQSLGRVPIAGAVATVAGLRLTAESLAGRRNRIGTVTVERIGSEGELARGSVPGSGAGAASGAAAGASSGSAGAGAGSGSAGGGGAGSGRRGAASGGARGGGAGGVGAGGGSAGGGSAGGAGAGGGSAGGGSAGGGGAGAPAGSGGGGAGGAGTDGTGTDGTGSGNGGAGSRGGGRRGGASRPGDAGEPGAGGRPGNGQVPAAKQPPH